MSSSHEEEEKQAVEPTKCFSVVQTKKFWSPLLAPAFRLCPSMDLIILGMQAAPPAENTTTVSQSSLPFASSLWVHRTVSWQRLATLTNNFDGNEDSSEQQHQYQQEDGHQGVTHVAWSPDGRNFALALRNGNVALYHVEAMVSSPSSMSEQADANGLLCVIPTVAQKGIVGLTWAHVGRSHPRWHLTSAEEEEMVTWR
mgnify:CR=1 FL=1